MAAAQYQSEEEPAAVAVALENQLVHLNMANQAEACSLCLQLTEEEE
jgi:hypothetical protein